MSSLSLLFPTYHAVEFVAVMGEAVLSAATDRDERRNPDAGRQLEQLGHGLRIEAQHRRSLVAV